MPARITKQSPAILTVTKYFCDTCGEEVEYSGDMLVTIKTWFVHYCKKCGKQHDLETIYPDQLIS